MKHKITISSDSISWLTMQIFGAVLVVSMLNTALYSLPIIKTHGEFWPAFLLLYKHLGITFISFGIMSWFFFAYTMIIETTKECSHALFGINVVFSFFLCLFPMTLYIINPNYKTSMDELLFWTVYLILVALLHFLKLHIKYDKDIELTEKMTMNMEVLHYELVFLALAGIGAVACIFITDNLSFLAWVIIASGWLVLRKHFIQLVQKKRSKMSF